jgi:hypothetical protein
MTVPTMFFSKQSIEFAIFLSVFGFFAGGGASWGSATLGGFAYSDRSARQIIGLSAIGAAFREMGDQNSKGWL